IVLIVLSVGAGIKALILEQISSFTAETIYVEIQVPSSRATQTQKDANTTSNIGMGVMITTLKLKDRNDVLKLPNIKEAYAILTAQEKFTYQSNEKTALIFAVEEPYARVEKLNIEHGRFYTAQEDRALKNVVVLGSELKNKLFGQSDAVGQNIKIRNQSFSVIGVAAPIGTKFFLNMDEIAYLPVQTAQKKLMGINHIMGVFFSMVDKNYIDSTISQIERIIRKNHGIKDPEKDDFVVRTMEQSMDIVNTVTGGISILLVAIAAVSLVVGGVGIMNVMYVSVTERTGEIGLKKAVGAKPYAIRLQFIQEAVLISGLGGVLGIFLGIAVAWLVSFVAINFFSFNWPFVVGAQMILFSFSVPVMVGIAFGYAPAQKAAELNPIDALRSS
ncbi:ABC transporter permease, partial [Patescibacteria group bacterium]|nr:ABC transporter permease [Patescibacteria group bacterium]